MFFGQKAVDKSLNYKVTDNLNSKIKNENSTIVKIKSKKSKKSKGIGDFFKKGLKQMKKELG